MTAAEGPGGSIVDLRPLFADDADLTTPPPTVAPVLPGGECIAYESALNLFIAGSGIGKTMLIITITRSMLEHCLATGRKIVIIDPEDNPKRMVARMRMLGMPKEAAEVIIWSHQPSLPDLQQLVVWIKAQTNIHAVIADGLAMLLSIAGLKEDSNDDAKAFLERYLKPLAKSGPSVIITGHYGKEEGGGDVRGASAYQQQMEGSLFEVKLVDAYGPITRAKDGTLRPGKAGGVELIVWKDRHSGLGVRRGSKLAKLMFTPVSESRTDYAWTDLRTSAEDADRPKDRLAQLKKAILEYLALNPRCPARELRDAFKGDGSKGRDKTNGWAGIDVTNATKALLVQGLIANEGKTGAHAYVLTQKGRDTLAKEGHGPQSTFNPEDYRRPDSDHEPEPAAAVATA